jgi:hypothetical protein
MRVGREQIFACGKEFVQHNNMNIQPTGTFRAILTPYFNTDMVEEFIIAFRARLAQHGVDLDLTKWTYSKAAKELTLWLPREHRPLIKSFLTLMFQAGEFSYCRLPPGIAMRWVCGFRAIETYNSRRELVILRDAETTRLLVELPWRDLMKAEEEYKKNGTPLEKNGTPLVAA